MPAPAGSTAPGSAPAPPHGRAEPHRPPAGTTGVGTGMGTGHPLGLRGQQRDEASGGCARGTPAVSVRAQAGTPLPIISNSFLIYLNKQAVLTSAEVFEQPGPG